jgi:chorismate mutase
MVFTAYKQWFKELNDSDFIMIAGPCSAETRKQVTETAIELNKIPEVKIFRSGIWKPRTNPNQFEGVGAEALEWLKEVKQATDLLTCVEVACPEHVELCLKNNVDILWIGARTTVNPFSVQSLADVLKGVDIPVLVKNPVSPDLKLWIGAIERFYKSGLTKLAAVHRGFYPFESTRYRNVPKWELMIELKSNFQDLPVIIDPSHIAGKRDLIEEVIKMAMCLNVEGFMIEVHNNPDNALSDSFQQITPNRLSELLKELNLRNYNKQNANKPDTLSIFRQSIDSIDFQLIELLAKRMEIVKQIGEYKILNNLSVFQVERWKNIVKSRLQLAKDLNLDASFIKNILQIIHNESIEIQSKIKFTPDK